MRRSTRRPGRLRTVAVQGRRRAKQQQRDQQGERRDGPSPGRTTAPRSGRPRIDAFSSSAVPDRQEQRPALSSTTEAADAHQPAQDVGRASTQRSSSGLRAPDVRACGQGLGPSGARDLVQLVDERAFPWERVPGACLQPLKAREMYRYWTAPARASTRTGERRRARGASFRLAARVYADRTYNCPAVGGVRIAPCGGR